MAVNGNRIKQLRKEAGLTQEALGKKLGVVKQTISSWENNVSEPNSETLTALSKLFGVSVAHFFNGNSSGIDYANYTMDTPEFGYGFKCKLKEILQEKNISAEQFSEMTNFHAEDVGLYLYGNKIPSIQDLIKISGALGISADYLLNLSDRKNFSEEEKKMLDSFNKCDSECKKYLIAKAGVLCVEGISAVAAGEYGKYVDEGKKSCPSSGTGGKGA